MPRRLLVRDVNAHVKCTLCDGYLVDATAIIECLHAFCRTCIVRYLEESKYCPVCDVQVHKTKPLLSIRSDQTLQDVVYKVVPGLYRNEMRRRRRFYAQHPEEAAAGVSDPEERGEGEPRFLAPEESVSLCLRLRTKEPKTEDPTDVKDPTTRHLKCPAAFTVAHLKKFVHLKFSLPNTFAVDIFYDDRPLKDSLTLMDVAYIFSWKRAEPMKFLYTVTKRIARCVQEAVRESVACAVPETSVEPEPMEVDEAVPPQADAPRPSEPDSRTPPPVSSSSGDREPPSGLHPLPEYNSVKVVSVPECGALLSPTNGFRLKFIHDPDKRVAKEPPSSRKSGRKGGRSSRHKSIPVRLARLAPYPPPAKAQPATPQRTAGNPISTLTLVSTPSDSTEPPAEASSLSTRTPATFCNVVNVSSVVVSGMAPVTSFEETTCTRMDVATTLATCSKSWSTSSSHGTQETALSASSADSTRTRTLTHHTGSDPPRLGDLSEVPSTVTAGPSHSSVGDIHLVTQSDGHGAGPMVVESTQPTKESSEVVTSSDRPPSTPVPTDAASETRQSASCSSQVEEVPPGAKDSHPKKSTSTVLSAEYSDDDDDLGCQLDLVVDERKMEEGDSGSEDAALRKRIDAIASSQDEEADVVTDDTEADSGRASDMSCPTRSCGEDDCVGSPVAIETTVGSTAPVVSVTVSEDGPHRHKTNSIDHVIKQLYLQRASSSPKPPQRTQAATSTSSSSSSLAVTSKDDSGVLDLSTGCSRKPGEGPVSSRPRPVANPPVLDLKHRQQNYLPAPIKQHTACPPAPKHPTSPLLLHQLTSHHHGSGGSILQAQLTAGGSGKQHLLHPLHQMLPYSIHGRTFPTSSASTTSCSYKFSPSAAHQAFSSSMLPYAMMNVPGMSLASHQKEANGKTSFGCQPPSKRLTDALLAASCRSPATHSSMLRTTLSPHHRSASPAPSPQFVVSSSSSSHTKKSEGATTKLPSVRFKKGPNLAVFNPDPNGFCQKLVIKNLDSRPTGNHQH